MFILRGNSRAFGLAAVVGSGFGLAILVVFRVFQLLRLFDVHFLW